MEGSLFLPRSLQKDVTAMLWAVDCSYLQKRGQLFKFYIFSQLLQIGCLNTISQKVEDSLEEERNRKDARKRLKQIMNAMNRKLDETRRYKKNKMERTTIQVETTGLRTKATAGELYVYGVDRRVLGGNAGAVANCGFSCFC